MTLAQIKKELNSLVIQDIGKALKKLESILNSDSNLTNLILMQQAKYNSLKKEKTQGTISNSNLNLRTNQLTAGILGMIEDLDEDDVDLTSTATISSNNEKQDTVSSNSSNSINSIDTNSGIYISYAWGGDSEKIVDLLDAELQKKSVKLTRDKRDLGYKGSIVGFMEDIGKGNKIIVVISEKYLKSENCMFELTQIYENKDFAKRIFPIVLEDADIYSPVSRIKYIKYWNDKIAELDEAIKSAGTGLNMTQIQKELNNYGDIRAAFDKMAFVLKDMNALTPEMHRNENFEDIYSQLVSS